MTLIKIKSLVINLDNVAYWEAVSPTDHWNPPKRSQDPLAGPGADARYPKLLYDESGDLFVTIHFVGTAIPLTLDFVASKAFLKYAADKGQMEQIQVGEPAAPGS